MIELKVSGMICGGCVRWVTNAVHGVAPGALATVDLATKRVSVETDVDAATIAAAIESAGYEVERQDA
ncbi:heavy-metal-associated domain-containing protein [Sphingosinithalassobacter sp. CS137]|uniref:heavy-metal-associated domain-containing protein n=1 Tax=Sphingosinithalassobacter sp. CS137 TaxID=2762748 RepID=UPI00165DA93D|nr:heavy-metal-associated domain-containing protein [Sphingosinithalassobacter sp. CS137]